MIASSLMAKIAVCVSMAVFVLGAGDSVAAQTDSVWQVKQGGLRSDKNSNLRKDKGNLRKDNPKKMRSDKNSNLRKDRKG